MDLSFITDSPVTTVINVLVLAFIVYGVYQILCDGVMLLVISFVLRHPNNVLSIYFKFKLCEDEWVQTQLKHATPEYLEHFGGVKGTERALRSIVRAERNEAIAQRLLNKKKA